MANTETRVEFSNNPDNQLTCVPLFHYTQPEIAQSRNFYETMAKFSSDYRRSKEYWGAKALETKKLRERMEANTYQTSLELVTCTSFVTSGMAYLKFLDNFYPELSNGQIFNFFKLCLEINTQGSQIYEVNEAEAERISMRDGSPDFIQKQMMPLLQKAMHHIPDWFKGSQIEYLFLLKKYASFELLLNPEIDSMTGEERTHREKQKARDLLDGKKSIHDFGATVADGIPDWIDDDQPPERSLVEKELAADLKEYELLLNARTSLIRGQNYLNKFFNDKYHKNVERFRKRFEGIRITNPRLGDFLSFLHLSPGEDLNGYIKYYIDLEDRISDSEAQALWIEENMKKAGIINGGVLTSNGYNLLNMMFFELRGLTQQEEKQKLIPLRQVNKKGHDALRFNLQPLVNILTDEDILLLDDFLGKEKDIKAGSFISFFADILVGRLKNYEKGKNPNLDKCLSEGRVFLGKILRNNWQAFFYEFEGILWGSRVLEASKPSQNDLFFEEEAQAIAELEDELIQARVGNLPGWKVTYSADQTTYPSHLIEIPGESIGEMSSELASLFVKLGTSNSIKVTSIIQAIDWKTQVPGEVEQLVPTIVVKGEEWKKIKRGPLRILYQMNPKDKTFIFFVHQKKSYHYNLPAA